MTFTERLEEALTLQTSIRLEPGPNLGFSDIMD